MSFQAGERKHEKAEELLPEDQTFTGIFAIFVSKAPALLWEIKKFENCSIDIRRKKRPSYEEQKRTYFRYNYSLYQIEYSRNFLFQ